MAAVAVARGGEFSSPLELWGPIPENGGSKPTAIVVGQWVCVFPPKYTGDLP